MKLIANAIFCFCLIPSIYAQTDLLKGLEDSTPRKEYVSSAFKSSRVVNAHSIEMIGAGTMDFRILHRFGPIDQGFDQFFGLDQASMRMGFDFGITKDLTLGIGRSTFKKDVDAFVKYRVVQQSKGPKSTPFSLIAVAGLSTYTYKNPDPTKPFTFSDRSAYYLQAIIGKKISTNFSMQLSPTLVHRNMVQANDEKDIYALGFGVRYKISKRMAIIIDYFYVANGFPNTFGTNPLSIGLDIETGGHIFQLNFSNTAGMNERSFITETVNRWGKGEVQFGFNLSRTFNIRSRK
jgi:hypothetical protein